MNKIKKSFFHHPLFWIVCVCIFLGTSFFSAHFYPKAFPVIDLQIKMDRKQALIRAKDLAIQNHWGPEGFQQSASFDTDQQVQTFVELAGGGKRVFASIIKEKLYSPYTWLIRHFKEGQIQETSIAFTPEGEFYGFKQSLPENLPGPAIPVSEALKIAETSASKIWNVSLIDFQLIEKSNLTQPGKRVDHTFVYERKNHPLGEGKFRLALTVSGDRLTEVRNFVEIPAAFTRKYGEMRSANDTIAGIASASMAVFYIIGGCCFGIFYLTRKKWLLWKPAVVAGLFVALLQALEKLNQFPLAWMQYDTAIPKNAFILRTILSAGFVLLAEFLLLSLSFMAAEGLSRLAFPGHPQLWKVWKPKNASSPEILGRTVGGYLAVGFFYSFVICIYFFGSNVLGWWSPSDVLFQPDSLATYFPWFTSIAQSLHAGFWEESLFRAVPLASAALLGNYFGRRKTWLTLGFVIQALIFAAAHANYPAQPSYARVVELIIPSLFFGTIYVVFGLLPGIILHFTFDVISFAIPLFVATTPGIWMQQSLVFFFLFLPLWIVLYSRFKMQSWKTLAPEALNRYWTPTFQTPKTLKKTAPRQTFVLNKNMIRVVQGLGLIAILCWFVLFNFKSDTWDLNVSRKQAIEVARRDWEAKGVQLTTDWVPQAYLSVPTKQVDEFVWKTDGPATYHSLIGNYLSPPKWVVRFVRFNVDVAERAEYYQAVISKDMNTIQLGHNLPAARAGASLTEADARQLVLAQIEKEYHLKANQISEISSSGVKQPHRMDWQFIYRDPSVLLKKGEARIMVYVSGSQVTGNSRTLFIPEDWIREDRNQKTFFQILNTVCFFSFVLFFIFTVVYSVMKWTQNKFDRRLFKLSFLGFLILDLVLFLNKLPSSFAQFSTVEPKANQMVSLFAFGLLKTAVFAFVPAILFGYLGYSLYPKARKLSQHLNSRSRPIAELLTGASIGGLFRILFQTINHLLPESFPIIPQLNSLEDYFPRLMALDFLQQYVIRGLLLLLVYRFLEKFNQGWTQRRKLSFLLLIVFGFLLTGLEVTQVTRWIALGLSCGLSLAFVFYFLWRDQPRLIPVSLASFLVLSEFRQIQMRAYPEVLLDSGLAILGVGVVAYFWYRDLNGDPKGLSDRT